VREVKQIDWIVDGSQLVFEITANAFLYRMVRTIVGTLVQVGLGQLVPEDIKGIIAAQDLTQSAPPAPAHGLCLIKVTYPQGIF
jgi:tRNA pseudouridine38-40 synthase